MTGYHTLQQLIQISMADFQSAEFIAAFLKKDNDLVSAAKFEGELKGYSTQIKVIPFTLNSTIKNYSDRAFKLTRMQITKDIQRSFYDRKQILDTVRDYNEDELSGYFYWLDQRVDEFKSEVSKFLDEYDAVKIQKPKKETLLGSYRLESENQLSQAFWMEDLHNKLVKYQFIKIEERPERELPKFKNLFSGEPVRNKTMWAKENVVLYEFINLLSKYLTHTSKSKRWAIAAKCFIKYDDSPYTAEAIRHHNSKTPSEYYQKLKDIFDNLPTLE